jgi:hypothetical protein
MDTNDLKTLELLPLVVGAALVVASKVGSEGRCEGMPGVMTMAVLDHFAIAYRTPSAMVHGESNYGIDVWYDNRKMLSVCWNCNLLKDYEIVRFQRGPWVPELIEEAERQAKGVDGIGDVIEQTGNEA